MDARGSTIMGRAAGLSTMRSADATGADGLLPRHESARQQVASLQSFAVRALAMCHVAVGLE